MSVDVKRLVDAMDRETALLTDFAQEQECLLSSVRERTWNDLEKRLSRLRGLEEGIQEAEARRVEALPEGGRDARGFLAAMGTLETEARLTLERSYHAFNLSVLKVKAAVSRLDHYVGTIMGSLGGILAELLPHRKGRIYSSRGDERRSHDLPIVVDRNV